MHCEQDIAIIGAHVRVPGAHNTKAFFDNLVAGTISLSHFGSAAYPIPQNWRGVKGLLDDYDYFDAKFFNIPESEAHIMDPQHRILLESTWHALEVAGINPQQINNVTGIFASCSANYRHWQALLNNNKHNDYIASYLHLLGNDKDFLATRIAYKLNLTGPAMTIQSGCSSSLLSVHMACRSLQNFECDIAIAASGSVTLPMKSGYFVTEGMIYSVSGTCRPYAENADGTIDGNGVGVIILKRLKDAVVDKDPIWGVIIGSAVNNDGNQKVNFTSPSIDQQIIVMKQALNLAQITPEQVGYIEGHGTGTIIGDSLEITALEEVYGCKDGEGMECYLGSVKANIGHLDVASGIIGLIKACLSVKCKSIFMQPYVSATKCHIGKKLSRITFSSECLEWTDKLRISAVNSLGVGGTNVHILLQNHHTSTNSSIPLPKTSFCKIRYTSPADVKNNNDYTTVQDVHLNAITNDYDIQNTVFKIWNNILGTSDIDINNDNFFALGGNSLLAIHLIQEINKALDSNFSPAIIFDYPSLNKLCQYISQQNIHNSNHENVYVEL